MKRYANFAISYKILFLFLEIIYLTQDIKNILQNIKTIFVYAFAETQLKVQMIQNKILEYTTNKEVNEANKLTPALKMFPIINTITNSQQR